MGNDSQQRKCACCLITAVFWSRSTANNDKDTGKTSSIQDNKRQRGGHEDTKFAGTASSNKAMHCSPRDSKPSQRQTPIMNQNHQRNHPRETTCKASAAECYVNNGRRVPKEAVGISGELESMIMDYQKSKGGSNLVRASSGNVMLFGNLGNLRQGGNTTMDYHAKRREENPAANGKNKNHNKVENVDKGSKQEGGSLCRAVSTRMDPEQLKIMGNEDYKNGRFEEALALYDAAIALDPNKASYRSNKSAALSALGRLLEAVFECREAIRIDSHYHRAHHRLGNLNMRLGEIDKALYHYKKAGPEADPDEVAKVNKVRAHLNKCTEARRVGDWITLIKETRNAISSGADSAPLIFALQAEALLKLRRHQDAEETMSKGPNFNVDECTKFFGPIGNANLLVTQAQVYLAVGRFEDALDAVQRASKLDSNNRKVSKVMRKGRAVACARSNGNELFKIQKLGQFEKAVEDCTAALNLRHCYSKARFRRVDCNAKMERWEASIEDYEILVKERPEDEEIRRALLEAKEQLRKQRSE